MPKIQVIEKDLSWYYRQREKGPLTVYVPGLSTFGSSEPTLVGKDDFAQNFGGPLGVQKDNSYTTAASYLKSGIDVVFHRIIPAGAAKAQTLNTYSVEITNNTDEAISFEVNESVYNAPAGLKTKFNFRLEDKVSVDEALRPYDANDEVVILRQVDTVTGDPNNERNNGSYATIFAKYPGSFGNTISIKVKGPTGDSSVRYFYVYSGTTLIDNMIIDFEDPASEYYYESLESNYIDIQINGQFRKEWFPEGSVITLQNGSDYGANVVDPRLDAISQMASDGFFDELKDPYLYQFDLLTNGCFIYSDSYDTNEFSAIEDTPGYKIDTALSTLAESKGNCVYLLSGSDAFDADTFYNYCIRFNSSFVAAIGPWCYCQIVYNGIRSLLPGYYPLLIAWGESLMSGIPVWYAPAGVKRAKCTTVKSLKYPVGNAVLELWQNHDFTAVNDFKINPIMNLKQYGYCVYGNSTLLHNKADGSSSMLQSLGTRVLVNQIKLRAFDIALRLQFDQLTDDLFVAFKTLMRTYLDQVKYQGGLYDYRIDVDRSTVTIADLNQRIVPVIIKISPNPAAENFNIVCEVSRAGVTFTDEFED